MENDNELEPVCTIKEACRSEKCGRTSVYKRIKQRHYVAYKVGRATLLSIASLKAYRRRIDPDDKGNATPVVPPPPKPPKMPPMTPAAALPLTEASGV